MTQKRVAVVPRLVAAALVLGLALQIGVHHFLPRPQARAENLGSPPDSEVIRVLGFGESILLSKLSMLYLQSFDIQPGMLIPYRNLDYDRVEKWLATALALDPKSQYPMFAASHFYAMGGTPAQERKMLDFIHRQFLLDPNRRWQAMAQAALLARHDLKDLPLALKYADSLHDLATGPGVPFWARDMSALLLIDMNQLEAAKVLLGGLLAGGQIRDANEVAFLKRELGRLGGVATSSNQSETRRGGAARHEK